MLKDKQHPILGSYTEGGVNSDVFIQFLKRFIAGAKRKKFLIVDNGPSHFSKKQSLKCAA